MKGIYKTTLLLLVVLVLAACSRKKNTFLTRNAHAVKAEYNALYNGGVAFEQGKEGLAQTYRDNFWEILPVERLELEEKFDVPGTSKDPNFNKAEEKAAKAIQKHSIYIDGKEYNPQIDEAYMLLGKARYYDARFIPALDAFNFILDKYPTSNNINHAKVWKAKANIRLRNEEVALENLKKMLEEEELDDEEYADAAAIMAQAYINLDSLAEALPYMKIASEEVRDKELKGRYTFIKGQLYNRLEKRDSANLAFDEVIELNRKSPRVYMINAYIAKAKNFDYNNEDKVAFRELLDELENDRENRPFLDKIYNQIGEYYRNNNTIDTAVVYYNKSIQAVTQDRPLQAVNYQTLAEINFDAAEYKMAGSYYDSTLTNLNEGTRLFRRITKRRENLDDVINYEDIATVNDSVLRIAGMSEAQQLTYFTEYTQKLKAKAVADSIANASVEKGVANNEFFQKKTNQTGKGGPFYFYNPTTVSFGKLEFQKAWGNRKLEDNWRRSEKQRTTTSIEEEVAETIPIAENEMFNPQSYISKIPTDQVVLDSLAKERNFAYYQLGLIYKEKFKENELASNRLEKLLTYGPEERLILPSKYNLYKIYSESENAALAQKYKNDILNNHADSRYAEILRNPNTALATDESSPEFKYKELYQQFEASQYEEVIAKSDDYISRYNGTEIVPKFELLKATAIGRQQGFEAYKKALNFISLNYPNAPEGKQAEKIFSTVLPKISTTEFVGEDASEKYKLVYQFNTDERTALEALQKTLNRAIDSYNYSTMSTSIDYYAPGKLFLIVHGLNTKMGARGFGQNLKENKEYRVAKPFFEISSPNYKTIQIHKNLDDYLQSASVE
ncbi:type IX secretion system periplasmic lipoprotein PorW/SprE [Cochleicola gelatinilyticus]|uniref:Gliding motility protein n=1 Tax=Cochleicola gelatinilyticus TaxID=1763537 RepID=A0A167J0Q0_9FLAO|nr:hypothetical protein [Cochleicola gelatinilyticus]OAB80209.1 hypothetical protein ULVI_05590 [Cochleicola gelatinilyticus]